MADLNIGVGSTTDTAAIEATAAALDNAAASADELGDQAKQAGRAVDDLGDEAAQAGRKVDDLGDEMRGTTRRTSELAVAIEASKGRLRELLTEFDRTGDTKFLKDAQSERGMLGTLTRMSKELDKLTGSAESAGRGLEKALAGGGGNGALDKAAKAAARSGEQLGEQAGVGMIGALQEAFSGKATTLPPQVQAALVAGAVAASPIIAGVVGAGVAAGVLGIAGGGGLAIGIAGAVKDPRVAAAMIDLGDLATKKLADAGQAFIRPLLSGIHIFETTLDGIDVAGMVRPLAGVIEPLARGLSGLVTNALPGVQRMLEASAPLFAQIARDAPLLGAAIGLFADQIAEAGPEARMFTHDLITGLSGVIVAVGAVINEFATLYGWLRSGLEALGIVEPIFDAASSGAGKAGAAMSLLAFDTDGASTAAKGLENNLESLFNKNMSVAEATLRYKESVTQLTDSLAQNGNSFDENTKMGQANMNALLAQVKAAEQVYRANLNAGMSAEEATAKYNAQIDALAGQARAGHATQKQIDDLINTWHMYPESRNTDITTKGGTTAAGDLNRVRDAAYAVPRALTISIGVTGAASVGAALGAIPRRAGGGRVLAGQAYVVGDGGRPELYVPDQDGMILPRVPQALPVPTGGGSGGYGGASAGAAVLVLDSHGSRLDDLIVDIIREAVDRSGGSVQVALGRPGVS